MSADCTLLRGTLAGLKAEELDDMFVLLSAISSLGSSGAPAFTLPQNFCVLRLVLCMLWVSAAEMRLVKGKWPEQLQ